MVRMVKVVVIGGGLSGLSSAYALSQEGHKVCLLEAASALGGAIASRKKDGFLLEEGAQSFLIKQPESERLLEKLNLSKEIVVACAAEKERFIAKAKGLVALPTRPQDLLTWRALSSQSKWLLLKKSFQKSARCTTSQETLAEFTLRHFNEEILDTLVQPLATGTCAGNARELLVRDAFPFLVEAEEAGGGCFIRGLLRLKKERGMGRLVSFKKGLSALPEALGQMLKSPPRLGVKLHSVEGPPWKVCFSCQGRAEQHCADELVLATPAYALASLPLPRQLTEYLSPLSDIVHPSLATVHLGYRGSDLSSRPRGFGALFAQEVGKLASGMVFTSSIFPQSAPEGKVLFTVFLGGSLMPLPSGEEELLAQGRGGVDAYFKPQGSPCFQQARVWAKSIPQYDMRRAKALEKIRQSPYAGLHLVGSYLHGVSLEDAFLSGFKLQGSVL